MAFKKSVTMSSIYDQNTIPSNAVDGDLSTSHVKSSLTKSENEYPWLMVDLGAVYEIMLVKVINRESGRSEPFDIRIGNSAVNGGELNDYCVTQCRIGQVKSLTRYDCPPGTRGRYASFRTPFKTYLDLCELEVYGFQV